MASEKRFSAGVFILAFFLLAVFAITTGCAQSHPYAKNPAVWGISGSAKNAANVPAIVRNAKVTCANTSPDQCPSAVALLVAVDPSPDEVFEMCTAFLIDPQTMLTNSHCLPKEIRQAGAACTGRVEILFPQNSVFAGEHADCAKIVSATELKDDVASGPSSVDYAVIKLTQASTRTPLQISRDGLPDQGLLHLVSIDPTHQAKAGSEINGVLNIKTCTIIQNSFLQPGFTQALSASGTVSDCLILQGNAGAPLIDDQSRVHAMVFGGKSAKLDPEKDASLIARRAPNVKFKEMGLVVNLACLDLPVTGLGAPADAKLCNSPTPSPDTGNQVATSAAAQKLYAKWLPTAPKAFEFQPVVKEKQDPQNNQVMEFMAPNISCIKDPATWQSLHDPVFKLNVSRTKMSVTYPQPYWVLSSLLDRYYRPSLQPTTTGQSFVTLQFDSGQLARDHKVQATYRSDATGFALYTSGQLLEINACN